MDPYDDNEFARYLAQYITDNYSNFVGLNTTRIEFLIKEFMDNLF